MPWLGQVGAVVEAWYPGSRGGSAIGRLLFGRIEPSGRLPVSFPASESQLPRPDLPGAHAAGDGLMVGPDKQTLTIDYSEGSDVGYRWYDRAGTKPLFPFGGGLTYTRFSYRDLRLVGGPTLTASFIVTNTGKRAGIETAQVYLTSGPLRRQERLLGWSRVSLAPGQSRRVSVTAPRRLIANWDSPANDWRIDGGAYHVAVGPDAATAALTGVAAVLSGRLRP
jgi:beta-glucosidase